jgi:LysM repeat protein
MKIWSVFSLVILFHLAVIGLLLVQPGCQTNQAPAPDPSVTAQPASQATATYAEPQPVRDLDPAFNAGVGSSTTSRSGLSEPRRPEGTQAPSLSSPGVSDGILQPVRDPVRDSFSLPPVNREVTVRKGDTLSAIARREGVSLRALMSANGLGRDATIYVGQTLLVPETANGEDQASRETGHGSGQTIEVRRGDTLSGIAARHDTTVAVLRSLNAIQGETIYVGQTLTVPGDSGAGSGSRATTRPAPADSGVRYTVQAGDTPSGIASRYGISANELMRANNISDPRRLYVGRELIIPGQSGSARPERRASSTNQAAPPPDNRQSEPQLREPTRQAAQPPEAEVDEDPMSALEALEDEDLPFVEVERVEEPSN